jgi:hypothetical protein
MGTQVVVWRLAVDIALVTAILVMTFRWMRTSRAQALLPKTLELEASLRALIAEADGAGRHLNDQLLRREQNLEKLLQEVSQAEAQLRRSIESGEDRSKELARAVQSARELNLTASPSSAPAGRAADIRPASRAAELSRADDTEPAWGEEDFVPPAPRTAPPAAPRTSRNAPVHPVAAPEQKIFSEDNFQVDPPAAAARNPLHTAYTNAEQLLKQGSQIEQVSAQTKLSADQVRLLAQMIEVERVEEQRPKGRFMGTERSDSRLGVLGTIRKQTSTN